MNHRTDRIDGLCSVEHLETRRMLAAGALGYLTTFGAAEEVDAGRAIAVDAAGNTYVAGSFRGKIDVNPSPRARTMLVNTGKRDDIFLAKYDRNNKLIWARRYGSSGTDTAVGLEIDPAGGVYFTGTFDGPIKFGGKSASVRGNTDVFIARINASGGVRWVRSIGGRKDDSVTAMAVGSDGDVYLSGGLRLAGYLSTTSGAVYIPKTRGVDDTFIVRLDGGDGSLEWHTPYGENDTSEAVKGMAVDGSGGVYVVGQYIRRVQFDRGSNSFTLQGDDDDQLYMGHLNGGGAWDGLTSISEYSGDPVNVADLAMGGSGDLFITGYFTDTIDLQPGGGTTLTPVGDRDAYVARYTADFDLVWARQLASAPDGDGEIMPTGIAVDAAENVYTTGHFVETIDFNPGPGKFNIFADKDDAPEIVRGMGDATDVYVSRLTGAGAFSYAKRIGGEDGGVAAYGLAADAAGNVYVTGAFSGTVDFDPGSAKVTRKTAEDDNDDTDVFIVKLKS